VGAFYNTSDVPDNQHTEFQGFTNAEGLHPYVKQYIPKVGGKKELQMNLKDLRGRNEK
jgi:hypothetical protein